MAADAQQLPLADGSMHGATVAFGIRNVASLDRALAEVYRVLAPGARFVILEFTTPRSAIVRTLYHFYFHHLLPLIGGVISGHRTAYKLPAALRGELSRRAGAGAADERGRLRRRPLGRRCRSASRRFMSA